VLETALSVYGQLFTHSTLSRRVRVSSLYPENTLYDARVQIAELQFLLLQRLVRLFPGDAAR